MTLITGVARSGTTIVGKLVHSFRNVEYAFEPPLLLSLITSNDGITDEMFKLLFDTYIYEDIVLAAIAGRAINTNLQDDSSIFNVKTEKEIAERLQKSSRRIDLEKFADNHKVAIKILGITPYLKRVFEIYSGIRFVYVYREPIGVINSLLRKSWFNLDNERKNLFWPFKIFNNRPIPFWVETGYEKEWLELDEINRCAYYYIRINTCAAQYNDQIVVNYDELVRNASKVTSELALKLGMEYGEKTVGLVGSIKERQSVRDMDILLQVEPALRAELKRLSSI